MISFKLFLILLLTNGVFSGRILGIFPAPSISHQVVFRALMEGLARRGHHLVVLTPNPVHYTESQYANITEIDVHESSYKILRESNFAQMKEMGASSEQVLIHIEETMLRIEEMQLSTREVQNLINDPNQKFDLCFIESRSSSMFGFKDHFDCIMVIISSLPGTPFNYQSVGTPINPVVYLDAVSLYFGEINFWQRLHLVYLHLVRMYIYYWETLPRVEKISKKIFGNKIRTVAEIANSVDMFFVNEHQVFSEIRPTTPATVYMGSMHIKQNKPLPDKYRKILDEAKNGAIYFSLGSNVKSVDLTADKRSNFLEAFREMPYTVLWKWENDTLPDMPSNVHISKWLPQQDILAHPNVKLFITQGGQQSLEEAIHHKVPLIGMPFLGDQDKNVKKIVHFGIGLGLDIVTLEKDTLKKAITDVIQDPKYRQSITKLSNLINDSPQTPLERSIWWTEYLLRNGGAAHLRSAAHSMPFYQYFLLDIIAFVILCFIVSAIIIFYLIRKLYACFYPLKSNKIERRGSKKEQ